MVKKVYKMGGFRLHTRNIHSIYLGNHYTRCLGVPYTYKHEMFTKNMSSTNNISKLCVIPMD